MFTANSPKRRKALRRIQTERQREIQTEIQTERLNRLQSWYTTFTRIQVLYCTVWFDTRGHRTGAHTDATSTPLEGPWTPLQQPYSISRRAGPQRLAPLGRLKRRRGPPCALAAQAARGRRLAEGLPQGAVTGTSVAQRSVATAGVLSGKTPSLSTTPSPTSSTAGPSASPQALETGSPAYRLPAACGFARAIAAPRPQQRS